MKLTNETINKIRHNAPLRRALIDANDKSERKLYRWLASNSKHLCSSNNLNIISAYLKTPIEHLIEEKEQIAA
jgi:hypothetical protein